MYWNITQYLNNLFNIYSSYYKVGQEVSRGATSLKLL